MISIIIDGRKIQIKKDTTILEAANKVGIDIPTLCYLKGLEPDGSCRICLVKVEGAKNLVTACSTPCTDGMVITTIDEDIRRERRGVLDLILSTHKRSCFACQKSGECKLQEYCYDYDIEESTYKIPKKNMEKDESNKFFIYDKEKCILCRKCVRVCSELQCNGTWSVVNRGIETRVEVPFERTLEESNCVSCGNCVSVCPVGALVPKEKTRFRRWETRKVKTTCPYCGVGCQMNLVLKGDKVVDVEPLQEKPNNGLLCVKGKFAFNFINHPDRLKAPLIRKDGQLKPATWEEAISLISTKINEVKKAKGPDGIAGLASARCTNEDNYLFQKMMRAAIGTNNVDHCARLCHASTVAGLAITLGSGAMSNSIEDLQEAETIFLIGANTTETHPVIGANIRRAVKKGSKLIVADPREIDLAKNADTFLKIKPGTNVALINGMINYILKEQLEDKEYINSRCENFEEMEDAVKEYTTDKVAEICQVREEDIIEAAKIYGRGKPSAIFYAMGVTQHSTGTDGVKAISNLALICGNIGKSGGGVNPLRGQNNVQGACDMGCLPGDLTGYQKVWDEKSIDKFQKAWERPLSNQPGKALTEMMDGILNDEIKLLYIMGENPILSDPDQLHIEKALEACEFLVVQDIFLSQTAMMADVVLPATSFAEKDGTFTNTERRVQRVHKALEPISESKADWQIISEIMEALGYRQNFKNPKEIFEEISQLTPSYGGISYERINEEGLQWPCTDENHDGTPILHERQFARGEKALLCPTEYIKSKEEVSEEFPFILSTGRILYHYHTMTMTGREKGLVEIEGESYVEINPIDAKAAGISEEEVIVVYSLRGQVKAKARITDRVLEGNLFMPFHFEDGPANRLTNTALDPIAKIPELKVCAAAIRRVK